MTTLLIPLAAENPLLPAVTEIIAAVVFAVLLWIVIAKAVVPRFEKTYAERADAIQGGMERAEKAQAEAQVALESYTNQLTELRTEAARIREDAKNQGATVIAEMREQANVEATRIVSNARSQIEAERGQVTAQLRNEIGGLATTLAGRIVGESLDDDDRTRRTVDRFIADLENSSSDADATTAGRS